MITRPKGDAMKTLTIAIALVLLFPAAAALAQEAEKFDMEGAIRKVGELLRESERLMVECLKPGGTSKEAAEKAEKAKEAIDDLLKEAKKDGEAATSLMGDIVKNAPQRKGGGGGGHDKDQKEPSKQEDEKIKEDEKKVDKKDPKNSKDGDPETKEKSKDEPTGLKKKPKSETGDKSDPDPLKDWVASLPPEVRKAFENRDWDKIPPKWREVIREYMKGLAESEED
jgi:hypothetical protein